MQAAAGLLDSLPPDAQGFVKLLLGRILPLSSGVGSLQQGSNGLLRGLLHGLTVDGLRFAIGRSAAFLLTGQRADVKGDLCAGQSGGQIDQPLPFSSHV
ncbi:MAG: hypothetical protein ACLUE8_08990 [Lachnospiraceae bacterium]